MTNYLYAQLFRDIVPTSSQGVLALAFLGLCGVLSLAPAYANPGVASEPRREQQVVSPEVQKVQQAIHDQVKDNWFEVSIVNERDAVVLRGEVDSERGRQRVVAAARSAVTKPIKDELRIRPTLTDDQIASQLRSTIDKEYPTLSRHIKIEVKDGTAYFSGNLRSHREVDQVLATALMQEGLKNIESDITCAGRPYGRRHLRAGKY
jgi:osmotically-inducible protein OsmY